MRLGLLLHIIWRLQGRPERTMTNRCEVGPRLQKPGDMIMAAASSMSAICKICLACRRGSYEFKSICFPPERDDIAK